MLEAIKCGADLLPKCQLASQRETTRRQDDHQRKYRRPNLRRRKRPKAINQALEEPHPVPIRWREMHDAIKVTRSRFPAASGYRDDGSQCGEMEGDGSSGARPVYH